MRRVAIVSSFVFTISLVGVFTFPDIVDAISGRMYQLSNIIEKVNKQISLASVYTAFNPDKRYLAVAEGMRKEEVANLCQEKLGWDNLEEQAFAGTLSCSVKNNDEGYLLPGTYIVDKNSSPKEIKLEMKQRFDDVLRQKVEKFGADPTRFDTDTVITIASIIQREAGGLRDMNLISGIIWNRLALGMPLQVDATLQYIKGKDGRWWPYVLSKDKYLNSAYNTYQNVGLPPTPISNPGEGAIEAALNPEKTDCVFYLHDKYGRIHCSKDYAEHKRNINKYLR
ncbi:MAG: endolytic transglycosylase MltG [bacterium]